MAKQLLIYESAVPMSATRHSKTSYEAGRNYAFSAAVNAVPLAAIEFIAAAEEYAIVFAENGEEILPVAVLGIRPEQNLYLSSDSQWQAKYIPAFIRRYPFVLAAGADKKTLTLCIDETHPGLNQEGRGERLFLEDGKPSAFTQQMLRFAQQYQLHFERTRAFSRKLKELQLLEPMRAQLTSAQGGRLSVGGFLAVSRAKLRALSAEALQTLAKTDELELLYLHLYSLRNFSDVKDRLEDAAAQAVEAGPQGAPVH